MKLYYLIRYLVGAPISSWTNLIMSRDLIKDFIQHCEENNLDGVTDCLSRGVDDNTVSEDGEWSGLAIAAHKK